MPENGAMSSSGHVNSGGSALDRLSELVHGLFDFAGNTGVFGFGGFLKFFEQTDLVFGQPSKPGADNSFFIVSWPQCGQVLMGASLIFCR